MRRVPFDLDYDHASRDVRGVSRSWEFLGWTRSLRGVVVIGGLRLG